MHRYQDSRLGFNLLSRVMRRMVYEPCLTQSGEFAPVRRFTQACIQVQSDLNLLTDVLAWFDQFSQPSLPNPIWLHCQLALAEGFTNAVRHAHKAKTDIPIKLEVVLQDDLIEIKIWDRGEAFDLHAALQQISSDPNLTAEGGRGLNLLHQVADTLDYIRNTDGENCLVITKYFDARLPL